jgi:hypothetical protein
MKLLNYFRNAETVNEEYYYAEAYKIYIMYLNIKPLISDLLTVQEWKDLTLQNQLGLRSQLIAEENGWA